MYSDQFRTIIQRYLSQPPVVHAKGERRAELLYRAIDANEFVKNEATLEDLVAVIELVEKFGEAEAMRRVAAAKNPLIFRRGELSATGGKAKTTGKARAKSKVKKKTKAAAEKSSGSSTMKLMITKYYLAGHHDPDKLVWDVQKHLEAGWEPQGGISVAVRHEPKVEVLFSQAMVYKEYVR